MSLELPPNSNFVASLNTGTYSDMGKSEKEKFEEIELARVHLESIATGRLTNPDKHLKDFALQLHEIIGHWQRRAGTKNPLDYDVEFSPGISATLLQVFALVPEEYQEYIKVNDSKRSPNNQPYSWLDESIMNVLVHLECEKRNPDDTVRFGFQLAFDIREPMDNQFKKSKLFLELPYPPKGNRRARVRLESRQDLYLS